MTKKFLIDLKKWINCVCRQWIHCWWQWQFQFHLIDILCCVTCKCEQKLRLTFCANFKPRLMSPIFCKCSQCVLEFEIWAMWVKKPLACLQCWCSNATFVCCASLQQKSNDISLPAKSYCCSQMVVFHQAWNKKSFLNFFLPPSKPSCLFQFVNVRIGMPTQNVSVIAQNVLMTAFNWWIPQAPKLHQDMQVLRNITAWLMNTNDKKADELFECQQRPWWDPSKC